MTLAGFRSRWITPGVGVGQRLAHLLEDLQEARQVAGGACRAPASSAASVRPLTSFMVKYGRPSGSRPSA